MMVTSSFCFVSLLVLACVSSFASQAFGYYGLFCPIDIDLTAGDYDPCFDNIVRPLEEYGGTDETIRLTKDLDLDMKARGAAANPGAVIELLRPEELKPLENPVVELIVPRSAPSSSGWVFSSPIKIEAEHALIEAIVLPDLCSFAPGDPPCAPAELTEATWTMALTQPELGLPVQVLELLELCSFAPDAPQCG
jgi:hypothetical protein